MSETNLCGVLAGLAVVAARLAAVVHTAGDAAVALQVLVVAVDEDLLAAPVRREPYSLDYPPYISC
jgi:hypothetical protein